MKSIILSLLIVTSFISTSPIVATEMKGNPELPSHQTIRQRRELARQQSSETTSELSRIALSLTPAAAQDSSQGPSMSSRSLLVPTLETSGRSALSALFRDRAYDQTRPDSTTPPKLTMREKRELAMQKAALTTSESSHSTPVVQTSAAPLPSQAPSYSSRPHLASLHESSGRSYPSSQLHERAYDKQRSDSSKAPQLTMREKRELAMQKAATAATQPSETQSRGAEKSSLNQDEIRSTQQPKRELRSLFASSTSLDSSPNLSTLRTHNRPATRTEARREAHHFLSALSSQFTGESLPEDELSSSLSSSLSTPPTISGRRKPQHLGAAAAARAATASTMSSNEELNTSPILGAPLLLKREPEYFSGSTTRLKQFQHVMRENAHIFSQSAQTFLVDLYSRAPQITDDAVTFAKKIHKRITEEKRSPGVKDQQQAHVFRALSLMITCFPNDNDNDKNYKEAVNRRDAIYLYMQMHGKNFLIESDYRDTLHFLQNNVIEGELHDHPDIFHSMGPGFYFDTAINIANHKERMKQDFANTFKFYTEIQSRLYVTALTDPHLTSSSALPYPHDLGAVWSTVKSEIDSIYMSKIQQPILLNYKKLTYDDSLSAFLSRSYPKFTPEQGKELKGRLITLINLHMRDNSADYVRCETLETYRQFVQGDAPEGRMYIVEEDVTDNLTGYGAIGRSLKTNGKPIGGMGFYSLPDDDTIDATKMYFIARAIEYIRLLNFDGILRIPNGRIISYKGDSGNYRVRAKALLDICDPHLIPQDVPRRGSPHFNETTWSKAVSQAQFDMTLRILPALEGCSTGQEDKFIHVERDYQQYLGIMLPITPTFGSLASIVRKYKLDRILETGENPFPHTEEERVTTPAIIMNGLRGPLCLLGEYTLIIGANYGHPTEPQNSPVEIVRNMFVSDRPDRSYTRGFEVMPGFYFTLQRQTQRVPVKPPLTVKGLVEMVYAEFDNSILSIHLHSFLKGDLLLLKEQYNVDILLSGNGIFYQQIPSNVDVRKLKAKHQFTREMAFYLLEQAGYVIINPQIKKALYKVDQSDQPGKIRLFGKMKSLRDLIDEY